MGIPLIQKIKVAKYIFEQKIKGNKKYPLVLMLEPLFRCNLSCAGCGKIDYPDKILNQRMTVKECLDAVDECGAPVVSIPGGEPLVHKEIGEIVKGIIKKGKFVYLCTNALLLEKKLNLFEPSQYLTFSIHLDVGVTKKNPHGVNPGVRNRTKTYIAGGYGEQEFSTRSRRAEFAYHLADTQTWNNSVKLSQLIVGKIHQNLDIPIQKTHGSSAKKVAPGVFSRNLFLNRSLYGIPFSYIECLYYNHPKEFKMLSQEDYTIEIDGQTHFYSQRLLDLTQSIKQAVVEYFTH